MESVPPKAASNDPATVGNPRRRHSCYLQTGRPVETASRKGLSRSITATKVAGQVALIGLLDGIAKTLRTTASVS